MIQEHLAVGKESRTVEDGVTLDDELPAFLPRGVGSGGQSGAKFRGTGVEGFDELRRGLERQRLKAAFGEIEFGRGEDCDAELGELRDVRRKLAKLHGFGMRGEVGFVAFGDAAEGFAGGFQFGVEFE